MKIYLVGGAVRDELLGRPVTERDWLVEGATAEEMRARGFRQVGKDFPVFLHPVTGEEHALPRRNRREADSGPVAVEEDLARRDLTINALARGEDGGIIDPCGGRADLERRWLRHTPSFRDDPIRVLRLARFAARYASLGFRVAPETVELVRSMVADGELADLVPERLWAEVVKALAGESVRTFFDLLREMAALAWIVPELDRLFGVPQPKCHHPEIDTGEHSLLVLEQAALLSMAPEVRFAALVHDLGKGKTPPALWPSHKGHEEQSAGEVAKLCKRLRVPNGWRDLAVAVARFHTHCHRALELRPVKLLQVLTALDALRRPGRFEGFLLACEADMRGRTGFERRPYPQAAFFRAAREAAAGANEAVAQWRGVDSSRRIGEKLRRERLRRIAALRN